MTLADLNLILNSIDGFSGKVAYRSFPVDEAPQLPFITYYENYANNFSADGIVHFSAPHVTIELYTEARDLASEQKIENALTTNNLFYTKDITYVDDEKCYMVIYESEL